MAEQKNGTYDPAELTPEEWSRVHDHTKKVAARAAVRVVTYPLTFAKVLFQLGHEPYPLSTGRRFIVAGPDAYFLPNVFKYLSNVYKESGLRVLYTGFDADILAHVAGSYVKLGTQIYIDRYYPDLGGKPANAEKDGLELTDAQSFQVQFRKAVRETLSHSVGVIISRPLTVIAIRQIAQYVGGDTKYFSVLGALGVIGNEEGPKGFFAGLVPALIAEGVVIWSTSALTYVIERVLKNAVLDETQADNVRATKETRDLLQFIVPHFVNSFAYPYQLISTIMALGGSGLVVSMLPYSPAFNYWGDAYDYLKPINLTRGARLFLREQKGAVSVGVDHRIYASNKYFI